MQPSMTMNYRKIAQNIFHPQMIRDIEDFDAVEETCKQLLIDAGWPLYEDDGHSEGWIEFIYEAVDIWEIAMNGFTYKREPNPEKTGGWEMVLYTRANHPAFAE